MDNSIGRGLGKLATKLGQEMHLERSFDHSGSEHESAEHRLEHIDAQLRRVQEVLSRLEAAGSDETAESEALVAAKSLLAEYSHERRDIQEWAGQVLDDRFKTVSRPHQRPIEKCGGPLPSEKMNLDAEARFATAEKYGFRFEGFSKLLDKLDFWKKFGPLLEQIPPEQGGIVRGTIKDWAGVHFSVDHPQYGVLFNAINGNAQIDYESVWSDEERQTLDNLKKHAYNLDDETIAAKKESGRSPMSVPHLVGGIALHRLNEQLPDEVRAEATDKSLQLIDAQVPNARRIELYNELVQLYDGQPVDDDLVEIFEDLAGELGVPEGHEGYVADVEALKSELGEDGVHAVVHLHHFDDGYGGYFSREAMHAFPGAFMIPSGWQMPADIKEGGVVASKFPEADETTAGLLAKDYTYRFAGLPSMPEHGDFPPVNPWDILRPDEESFDTEGNAANVLERLHALRQARGDEELLNVVLIATDYHGARAWADMRKSWPPDLVGAIKVLQLKGMPQISEPGKQRRPAAIIDAIAEQCKRLYSVTTEK